MKLVSVLISAYDVEPYVEQSIQSILDQTYRNLEIFIVDDGSNDNTLKIINRFDDDRVICYTQNNKGKASTLNDLIDRATGEYVMIHDADDISKPNRVEVLLNLFEKNESLGMAMSSFSLIINNKEVAPRPMFLGIEDCRRKIEDYLMPSHDPTLMVRSEIAKREKYNAYLDLAEGIDFIMRVGENEDIVVTDEVLYAYRVHPDSITKRQANKKIEFILYSYNSARVRRGFNPISIGEFINNYGKYIQNNENNLSGHFTHSSFLLVQKGCRIEALKVAITALSYIRLGPNYIKPLVYALMPKFVNRLIKSKIGQG